MEKTNQGKNLISILGWVLIILIVLVAVILLLTGKKAVQPVEKVTPKVGVEVKEDSTKAIDEELGKIEILDLEKEFQQIDAEINSL
jgi:signal transduction histidine kinase